MGRGNKLVSLEKKLCIQCSQAIEFPEFKEGGNRKSYLQSRYYYRNVIKYCDYCLGIKRFKMRAAMANKGKALPFDYYNTGFKYSQDPKLNRGNGYLKTIMRNRKGKTCKYKKMEANDRLKLYCPVFDDWFYGTIKKQNCELCKGDHILKVVK